MTTSTADIHVETHAPIPTWFGVGGRADRLARPATLEELALLAADERNHPLRILGDGANLLVADEGVDGLVVSLERLSRVDMHAGSGAVRAGAGASLPLLLTTAARAGLAGLEGLAGIPASVGGAVVMNAGGAFADIADAVARVEILDESGEPRTLRRAEIDFAYRSTSLRGRIVTSVTFDLSPDDPANVRDRLKKAMAYKKQTQPLADHSAGCVFKNPTISGARESAGRLIDQAGCKGLTVGGAQVSPVHANFFTTTPAATAQDILDLIERVRERVATADGVHLDTEIVIWRRGAQP